MVPSTLSESAKRSLRLICRLGRGSVHGLVIPTADIRELVAAGLLIQSDDDWHPTENGTVFDKRDD